MVSSSREVLKLYKRLLRECQKFSSYNFREYGIERIKYGFKTNKNINDPQICDQKINEAKDSLEVIKRQVIINKMFAVSPLVIEKAN